MSVYKNNLSWNNRNVVSVSKVHNFTLLLIFFFFLTQFAPGKLRYCHGKIINQKISTPKFASKICRKFNIQSNNAFFSDCVIVMVSIITLYRPSPYLLCESLIPPSRYVHANDRYEKIR